MKTLTRTLLAGLISLGLAAGAAAQGLPSEPITFGGGRFVVGAEVTATIGSEDPFFFNYTDYRYNALRNFRIGVSGEVKANERLQVLGELRIDHGDSLQVYGLFARIRPWATQRFAVQVGRVPPTFGAFGRGAYGASNLLIGYPLAYQYLTSLRTDSVPASTAELLSKRGRGWELSYARGASALDRGVPMVNGFRWDTGIQLHGVHGRVEWTGALTTGSLSNPRVDDDNGGRQLAGRVMYRPTAAVGVGMSVARGAFLSRSLADVLPAGRTVEEGVQQAFAVDAEYSIGRFLARGEALRSGWTMPLGLTGVDNERLSAWSTIAEARFRVLPGVHLAGRAERLAFSHVMDAGQSLPWEAPVNRYEVGAGWSVLRNVIVKASWQRNFRYGVRVRRETLGAAQIVYWF